MRPLMLLILCLAPSLKTWAWGDYLNDNEVTYIARQLSATNPVLELSFMIYDDEGTDTYWTHTPQIAGHDGPAIYIDGEYFASPDWELSWPSGDIDEENDDDDWWGKTYTQYINGAKWTLRFYNPYYWNDRFYSVFMRFIPSELEANSTHSITVKGYWGTKSDYEYRERTFYFSAPDLFGTAPTVTSFDGKQVTFEGTLPADKTNYYGVYEQDTKMTDAKNKKFVASDQLVKSAYSTNATTFSGFTAPLFMGFDPVSVPFELYTDVSRDGMGPCHYYKWYDIDLPGFIKPKDVIATHDMWKKQITLQWAINSGVKQSTNGTWSIYRHKDNTVNSERELLASEIASSTRKFTDKSVPAYDTEYLYEIVFAPKNSENPLEHGSLREMHVASCPREFNITNLTVESGERSLTVKWDSPAFGGNEDYVYKVYRSTNPSLGWGEPVGSVAVTNKNATSYTFTDEKNLEVCKAYYYKVAVTMLEGKTFDPNVDFYPSGSLTGTSRVTALTATKGEYNGLVKLTWTAEQVGVDPVEYEVKRRLKSTKNSPYSTIYRTSGTATTYYYEDNTAQPGQYYDYCVTSSAKCGEGEEMTYDENTVYDEAFCRSTGIVSGRISYGTGTAVPGVKVTLKCNDNEVKSQFYAMKVSGQGAGLRLPFDDTADDFKQDPWTVQFYVNPSSAQNCGMPVFFDMGSAVQLQMLSDDMVGDTEEVYDSVSVALVVMGSISEFVQIPMNHYTHVTISYNSTLCQLNAYFTNAEGEVSKCTLSTLATAQPFELDAETGFCFGGSYVPAFNTAFNGYVDEVRIFKGRCLTQSDILANYSRTLTGSEEGLFAYWPCDEGFDGQTMAYDYSKTNGVANNNHGQVGVSTWSVSDTEYLPTENQLSLYAVTDVEGNYVIRGVPFSGEGTNYTVTPTMGIHEFSPHYSSRYVSASSLVHSGVDFEDISSFPVSGVVYYEGTTYPVEGCNLYVDGITCSREGEPITTAEDGTFTISVPIGDHYISITKNGHTFVADGRYPADPNSVGVKHTFERVINNLEFLDNTLVNVTGRVVGGSIQGKKPVGFGLSTNNLGVSELVLTPVNDSYRMNVVKKQEGTTVTYETNSETLPVASQTALIGSHSYRGAGDFNKKIYIQTDAQTGEFSAMLPPLVYKVESMKVMATDLTVGEPTTIDVSNPLMTSCDTLYADNGTDYELYEYHGMLRQTYHCEPTFTVQQKDNAKGAFGIEEYDIEDVFGETTVKGIYTADGNGSVNYRFGYPVFHTLDPYTFEIEGYEEFVNSDDPSNPVTDRVPLAGSVVTIDNEMSIDQAVYLEEDSEHSAGELYDLAENQLPLDSLGQASYKWRAGLPNITAPYTRSISMTYDVDGRSYAWDGNGMKAIVLGELPTGNNFVTCGPDHVDMILRDPPGAGSSASWTKGTITTHMDYKGKTFYEEDELAIVFHLGLHVETLAGTGMAGSINYIDSKDDLTVGGHHRYENESYNSFTKTTTISKTISTSDDPEFTGAQGDVFIGTSTNITYGMARQVGFHRTSPDDIQINLDDVMTAGINFGTTFNYTQYHIETYLLPNFEKMKQSILQTVDQATYDSYVNTGSEPVYLTLLSPDDKNYGKRNDDQCWGERAAKKSAIEGPSYKIVVPENYPGGNDTISWINSQIDTWISYLAQNEEEKVKAYENRDQYLMKDVGNVSIDGGTSATYTKTVVTDTIEGREWTVSGHAFVGNDWGNKASGFGIDHSFHQDVGGGQHHQHEDITERENTFEFTLACNPSNALTVDVYDYAGDYGPIFRTRGGQTSAPYEGKVVTKYFRSGETIMEATMQIEVPQISVDVPFVTDVPSGSVANYTLRLSNASQIDEDLNYKLLIMEETNPDGARISIDDVPLTDNRIVKVPAGEIVTKSLQLRQTNTGVLDYNNIGIVLASIDQSDPTSMWEPIADTVYVSAQFVPSSSPVNMVIDHTVLNTFTGDDLNVTVRDFDRNYNNLKAFRIQYRQKGDTDWTLVHEYVINDEDVTPSNELLPAGAAVTYPFPMHAYSDGDYTFRVLSVSTYGTSEVTNSSEEITVTKDMVRPRLLTLPSPTDGILNAGDEISILFNEDLRTSVLNAADNFTVTADLNDAAISHDGVFAVSGSEGAKTTTSINLANQSFAFNFWMNWTSEGTILTHGKGSNAFSAAVDADGHLVITNGTSTHTSEATLPKDAWCFISLTMDYGSGSPLLSATAFLDASTIGLFTDEPTTSYEGNSTLTVGYGISAAIHELTLWNYARTADEAQGGMYEGKSAATDGLVGYWKLNEGNGAVGEDKVRSRHLTLPSATCWQMAAENIAINLDGKSYAAFNISAVTSTKDDDWMLEFWFKGNKPAATASLMSIGNNDIDLRAKTDGSIELAVNGTAYAVGSGYMDNNWHHIALNVLKGTNGSAIVYIDGQAVKQFAASLFPAVQSDRIILGAKRTAEGTVASYSQCFTGSFDEFRYWRGSVAKASIIDRMYVRLKGDESGLAAYYPMEKQALDQYNQIVVVEDKMDHTANGTFEAEIASTTGSALAWSTQEAPALKTAPSEENVAFSFVANERQIVLTLEESAVRLEGSTITFCVHDVTDQNGNNCLPVTWTAYVQQNRLAWSESEVAVRKEGTNKTTFKVDIVNMSGSTENWVLSGLPSWLTASSESGTLTASGSKTITFTVSGSVAVGNYEAIVGLTGNNGVTSQLVVTLNSLSEKPDWSVNPDDYENKMNVIGLLNVGGFNSTDAEDMIGAFIDGECRGVAQPIYFSRYDASFVMLDVFGNAEDVNKDIVFKVFDNSTGTLYPSVNVSTGNPMHFSSSDIMGGITNPVIFTTDDRKELNLDLKKGWNWISLNLTCDDMTPAGIFGDASSSIVLIKNKTAFSSYFDGEWFGSLTTMGNTSMHKVSAAAPVTVTIMGKPVDVVNTPITVANGWNWISYLGQGYMDVNEAFAGLEPQDGDVVNSKTAFSMYNDYEWVGTLTTMEPGKGYTYCSVAEGTKTFNYPVNTTSGAIKANGRRMESGVQLDTEHESSMCVIAQVTDGLQVIDDAVISVYAGDELRGYSDATVSDGLHFLSIQGEGKGTRLTVIVTTNEQSYELTADFTFDDEMVKGTIAEPVRLNIADVTSMRPVELDGKAEMLYDLSGRKVVSPHTGFYIRNNKKVLMK